jgi:hypothetical protein
MFIRSRRARRPLAQARWACLYAGIEGWKPACAGMGGDVFAAAIPTR